MGGGGGGGADLMGRVISQVTYIISESGRALRTATPDPSSSTSRGPPTILTLVKGNYNLHHRTCNPIWGSYDLT